MVLKRLELKNVRNYDYLALDFNPEVNIIVGDNGQGKTNILESIYLLAITKSHRTFIDRYLIKRQTQYLKIKGVIKSDLSPKDMHLELTINHKGKKGILNKKSVKKISDYISKFNVILFGPDDLKIIKESPNLRRRFLNIEIGQLNTKYLTTLNEYSKLLRNRNEYLKGIDFHHYDKEYLNILTNQLIDKAVIIYNYRKDFIDKLNECLKTSFNDFFLDKALVVKYITSVDLENNGIKEELKTKFDKFLNREIYLSQTIIGPHRDDLEFYIGDENIKDFASQGQQRTAVLLVKLAEALIFKKVKGENPILLLDDVFSELDQQTRNKMIRCFIDKTQIFITTTSLHNINKQLLNNAVIFEVVKGKVTKRGC